MQGLADWEKIRAVKEAVSIPVFANGNILYHSDIGRCLEATGADAVMSAEGNLYNPSLFAQNPPEFAAYDSGLHLPHADLALEYLHIVKGLKTKTSPSAMKGHLFKLLRPGLVRELDLRDRLGKVKGDDSVDEYLEVVEEMKRRMDVRGLGKLCLWIAADRRVDPERHERSGRGAGRTTDHGGPHAGHQNLASLVSSAILASVTPYYSYAALVVVDGKPD